MLQPGGTEALYDPGEMVEMPAAEKTQPTPIVPNLSPDGGAFLASQPMPKCGAFCYLAIACHEPTSH